MKFVHAPSRDKDKTENINEKYNGARALQGNQRKNCDITTADLQSNRTRYVRRVE